MKYIQFSLFFISIISQEIDAQIAAPIYPRDISNMAVVDSGKIRILYALNAIDIKDQATYDDLQRLEIGKSVSKYYSYFIFNSDSLCTELGEKIHKEQVHQRGVVRVENKVEHGLNIILRTI